MLENIFIKFIIINSIHSYFRKWSLKELEIKDTSNRFIIDFILLEIVLKFFFVLEISLFADIIIAITNYEQSPSLKLRLEHGSP